MGGKIIVGIGNFVRVLSRVADDDRDYHFRYLLDESSNGFQWAHWNAKLREQARKDGTSL